MKTSCIVLNETILPPNTPPVSALNPTFVVSLSLGRELGKGAGSAPPNGPVTPPLQLRVTLAGDDAMRAQFAEASKAGSGLSVHPYPLEALTGNYETYAAALKVALPQQIRYLAIGVWNEATRAADLYVNCAYALPEMESLIRDAATLGFAMGRVHPDEAFSSDVVDSAGVRHAYLTCIGHFFRKEKPGKIARLLEGALHRDDVRCFYIAGPDVAAGGSGPRMVALWAEGETLKELKVHQMSGARMHEDLIAFRSAVDASHQPAK